MFSIPVAPDLIQTDDPHAVTRCVPLPSLHVPHLAGAQARPWVLLDIRSTTSPRRVPLVTGPLPRNWRPGSPHPHHPPATAALEAWLDRLIAGALGSRDADHSPLHRRVVAL